MNRGTQMVANSSRQPLFEISSAHQNRTIAIASDFRADGAKSPEFPQKELRGFGLRNRSPKSQIASDFPSHPCIAMQHCFLLSQKSRDFWGPRWASQSQIAKPRAPKDWKNSRFRSGIETFKRPISDWNVQSRLNISIEIENNAPFVGNYQGRDWSFQAPAQRAPLSFTRSVHLNFLKFTWTSPEARLNISIHAIENFNRMDWKFQSYGLKSSRDQSGLSFFNCRALWEIAAISVR